jgi:hypothetical protein
MMVLRCRFSAVRKLLRKFAYFFACYGFGAIGSVQRWVRSEAELLDYVDCDKGEMRGSFHRATDDETVCCFGRDGFWESLI